MELLFDGLLMYTLGRRVGWDLGRMDLIGIRRQSIRYMLLQAVGAPMPTTQEAWPEALHLLDLRDEW